MNKLLQKIKNQKTIYVPTLWLAVLVVAYFFPQYAFSFSLGTAWGVLWLLAYNWFHDK